MTTNFTLAIALADYIPTDPVHYSSLARNDVVRILTRGPPDGMSVVRFSIFI